MTGLLATLLSQHLLHIVHILTNSSYVFGTIGEITDMENYKAYIARNVDILAPYNAKFLVRFGRSWLPEHEECTPAEPARCANMKTRRAAALHIASWRYKRIVVPCRTVFLQFPGEAAARQWYRSSEYQAWSCCRVLRWHTSESFHTQKALNYATTQILHRRT
jgi:uncharacterized protein (DUF1330 family)